MYARIIIDFLKYRIQLIREEKVEESGLKYLNVMTGSSGLRVR